MLTILITVLIILVGSAICSMAEAALLSLPFVRARLLFEKKRPNSKDLLYLKDNISDTIGMIVILNNTINIIGSMFIGQQVAAKFGNHWLGPVSGVLTFLIIIVSEIIPKAVGERFKIPLSLFFAKPVRWLLVIFRPFVKGVLNAAHPLLKRHHVPKITEDEIKMMLKLARVEGTVEMDEEVLCSRVFKLNDTRAFQIMKPIEQIYALPADQTLAEFKETIINCQYSRIVIYDKDPKDIIGMVQHVTLLREIAKDNYQASVRDFIVKPIFVDWHAKADALLEKFQKHSQHMFIVQDVQGKDVGIVTMEDVLEELFGEIYDEKDQQKPRSG